MPFTQDTPQLYVLIYAMPAAMNARISLISYLNIAQ
jgi:hypothetical protein